MEGEGQGVSVLVWRGRGRVLCAGVEGEGQGVSELAPSCPAWKWLFALGKISHIPCGTGWLPRMGTEQNRSVNRF